MARLRNVQTPTSDAELASQPKNPIAVRRKLGKNRRVRLHDLGV